MSSFSFNKENIDKLIEISIDAGDSIMGIYETDFDFKQKEDRSPLTEADILSNKIITQSLGKLTPNIPILSEESANIPIINRLNWNEYWLVDPLDGTKEFIKKNGEFTTNIAFIKNNRPIFGIIHAPAINETYWGTKDIGAYFLNGDCKSGTEKIRTNSSHSSKIRIITSRSHPNPRLQTILDDLDDYELFEAGSSLKFCRIASGKADCYPRLGPTSEWDTAAGEAILLSAGGCVLTGEGSPLNYNKEEGYLNPNFIASADIEMIHNYLSYI